MSRRLTILDRVTVKSPCHEDWNEMKGNDTVRFCSHCSKSVHNLSEMNRSEAVKLVEKSNGKICIRYVQTPSKSIVTKPDPPRPKLQFGRLGNLATGVFSLAAGMVVLVTPQTLLAQKTDEIVEVKGIDRSQSIQKTRPHPEGKTVISGIVSDHIGTPFQNATVKVTDPISNETEVITTNQNGEYSLPAKPACFYQIKIEADGFESWSQTVFATAGKETVIQTQLALVTSFMGIVNVVYSSELIVLHVEERLEGQQNPPTYPKEIKEFLDAIEEEDISRVKQLISQGISVNQRLSYADTPLMFAGKTPKVLKFLLAQGAQVNQKNDFGVTPLMYAVSDHNLQSVKLLLAAGANVNAQDNNGLTPLMIAAIDNNEVMVSLLLSHGAKINLSDNNGLTALEYAEGFKAEDVIEVLQQAGAKE